LVARYGASFVAARFERYAEVDMSARIPGRDCERLAITFARAREIARVLEPVSLRHQLLRRRDAGPFATGPVAFPQPTQHGGHSKRRRV